MERTGGGLGGCAVAMLPTVTFELAREESPHRHPLKFLQSPGGFEVWLRPSPKRLFLSLKIGIEPFREAPNVRRKVSVLKKSIDFIFLNILINFDSF